MAARSESIGIRLALEGQTEVRTALSNVERQMDRLGSSVQRAGHYGAALLGIGAGLAPTVGAAIRSADAMTTLSNHLRLVSGSASAAAQTQNQLFEIAQRSRTGLAGLGDVYVSIARSTQALGVSQANMLTVTEAIGNAMAIGGGSAEAMRAALTQLGQGLNNGALRGEEFNSVMEQAPRLAGALADGLGVPINALRQMAEAGELTTQRLIGALMSQSNVLKGEVATSVVTVGQAMTLMSNKADMLIASLNNTTGIFGLLASGATTLAEHMDVVAVLAGGAVANGLTRAAQAGYAQVGSLFAQRAASIETLRLNVAETEAIAIHTGMVLADTRAILARTTGMAASLVAQQAAASATIKNTQAIAAQTLARAALTRATSIGAAAMGLLGGPIGLITTALTIGATAWAVWGGKARDSAQEAAKAVEISTTDMLGSLDKQIAKLKERNALAKSTVGDMAQSNPAEARRLNLLDKQIKELQTSGTFEGVAIPAGAARSGLVATLMRQYGELYGKVHEVKALQDALAAPASADKLAAWMGRYATKSEQMATEIAKAKAELGAAFTPELEARIRARYITPTVAATKATDDLAQARARALALDRDAEDAAAQQVDDLVSSNQQLREQVMLMDMDEAHRFKVIRAKKEEAIAEQKLNIMMAQNAGASEAQIALMQRKLRLLEQQLGLLDEQRRKQIKADRDQADQRVRNEQVAAWDQTWAQVSQSFVDQLMQGGKNVKEYLKDLFRTLVLRPILAPIGAAVGSMFSSGAMASSAAAGGDLGSSLGIVSNIKSVYDTVVGGFAALGDSVAFAAQDLGAWMVQNTTGVLNSAGAELMANANAIGTAASYVGGVAAGIGLGTWISGDKAAFGDANIATVAGTAIGAVIAGPVGAAIGGALGGVFNQAFGMGPKQTRAAGLTGSFSAGGADVRTYADWYQKGGWFRSDKSGTNYGTLDATLKAVLDGAIAATYAATTDYARVLGLATGQISGFAQGIRLSLKDLSAADQEKAIADALSSFGDALVSATLPQIAAFTKLGETTGAALSRLGGSLRSVNQVLDTLNQTLLAGLAGGDAASKLLDLFGGAEGFVSSTSAYFQAYYTDAERAAIYTRQMGTAFANMGLTLPSTTQAYRDLVDAQDLTTASGRQVYAALMSLAPTFSEVAKTSQAAADAAAQEAKAKIDALRQSGQAVSEWLAALQGTTTGGVASLAMARRDYMQYLSLSRAGDVGALGKITGAASGYLDAAKAQARSGAEYRAIVAQVSAEMSALPAVRGWQDEMLAKLALLNETTGMVGGYTSATETNTAETIDALKRQIEVTALLNNQGLFAVSTNTAKALDNQVSMISYLKGIDASNAAMASKTTSSGGGGGGGGLISSIIGWLFADGAAFTGQGVYTQPTPFSFGGGKLGVMGEAGAEAVMPLQRTASGRLGVSADNPALIAEMRALREEVSLLRAEARATAVATTRTADLTKRVTRNGEGMVVQTDGTTVKTVTA
jgi:tape measure domain-containing protein